MAFAIVGPAGDTDQLHVVGLFVAVPLRFKVAPSHTGDVNVNDGTGGAPAEGTVSSTSSTAKEGSVPTPSSLLYQ